MDRVWFAGFTFDLRTGELCRDGKRVRLQRQPAKVLSCLLRRPGEIVTRGEIRAEAWGDKFLDFDQNLNFGIRQIRHALRDDAQAPRFIETVPGVGYRFMASLESAAAPPRRRLHLPLAGGAAILVATIIGAVRSFNHSAAGQPVIIVVEPLDPLGLELGELATTVRDDVAAQLATMDPSHLSVAEPGGESDYVLRGSIRSAADSMLLVARLVRVRDQSHVWARRVAFTPGSADDAPAAAREIARSLAATLLGPPRLPADELSLVNPRAREAYLKARYFLDHRGDAVKAVELFEAALTADPAFASAHAGLGIALIRAGKPADARGHLDAALRLSPDLATARVWSGFLALFVDWDLDRARQQLERAVAVAPDEAESYRFYAQYLLYAGDPAGAIRAQRRALELDPTSVDARSYLGRTLYDARRYGEAIATCAGGLELAPDDAGLRFCLVDAHVAAGELPAAAMHARRLARLWHAPDSVKVRVDTADAEAALRTFFQWMVRRLGDDGRAAYLLAIAHLSLGDVDAALGSLERGIDARAFGMMAVTADPRFDVLRKHPRFQAVLHRIGPLPPT